MKYALNLAEDGRILSATYPQFAPVGAILVDELPKGDICDYLCIVHEIEAPPIVDEPEVNIDSEVIEDEESTEVPEEPTLSYYVEYVHDPLPKEEVIIEPTANEILNALLGVNRYE